MSGHGRRGRGGGHAGGGGGHGGWLVTYADLLTLLMVLFLVLWVIAKIDLKKFEKFKEGLGDFGNPATEATDTGAGSGSASADAVTTTTLAPVITAPGALGADGALTGTGLDELTQTLHSAIEQAGLGEIVSVQRDERGVVLTVSTDDLLFDSGSATLKPNGVYVLAALSQPLHGFNNQILVGGHTDKRPLSTPGYTNFNLSFDRAAAVVNLLVDRFGIPPEQIFGAGYGASRPVAEGDDAPSLARNRRVEIVVLATANSPDSAAGSMPGEMPATTAPATTAPATSAPSPLIPVSPTTPP